MPAEDQNLNQSEGVDTVEGGDGAVQQSTEQSTADKVVEGGDKSASAKTSESTAAAADGDKDKPKSALDAVLKVLGKPTTVPAVVEQKKDGAAPAEPSEAEHKAAGDGEKEWISREEYAKLSPVVRRRISKLTTERNTARDESKAMQPKAKTHDDLVTYCRTMGLSQDDFAYGLQIMALVRTNPAEAWKQLQPLFQDLQTYVGDILPADLAKEVDEGKITEQRAKELAGARRRSEHLSRTSTETAERARQAEVERQYNEATERTTSAVREWEQRFKASDPDFSKKAERVWERMVTLLNTETEFGRKRISTERTVEIAERARKDVDDWVKGLLPTQREIKPGPTVTTGGGANVTAKKQPTTALEAAQLALAR